MSLSSIARPIPHLASENKLPLSTKQERRLASVERRLSKGQLEHPPFNISVGLSIKGKVDVPLLQRSFEALIDRHSVFRAAFHPSGGIPPAERSKAIRKQLLSDIVTPGLYTQTVCAHVRFALGVKDLQTLSQGEQEFEIADAIRVASAPFDNSRPPLLRGVLLRTDIDDQLLVIVVSHLISDLWSLELLLRDLTALYAYGIGCGSPLPDLPIQFVDFVSWQKEQMRTSTFFQKAAYYWKRQWLLFRDAEISLCDLPCALPKPKLATRQGTVNRFILDCDIGKRLRDFAKRNGTTLFVMLLTLFNILLYRYTRKSLLAVWVRFANRARPETENVIGWFANNHIVGVNVSGDPTGVDLLHQVRRAVIDGIANQHVPIEDLWSTLGQNLRRTDTTIVFDVSNEFSSANEIEANGSLCGLELRAIRLARPVGTQLKVCIHDDPTGIIGVAAQYPPDRFTAVAICKMFGDLRGIAEQYLFDPNMHVSEFS